MARYQVPDNVLSALIKQESGGRHNAVSNKGARGITQVMPDTARNPGFGITPLQNDSPEEYKRFTRDYLGTMVDKTGSLPLGLAAYNAGLGAVQKAGGIPKFKETQNYVKNIMGMINPISSAEASEQPYNGGQAFKDIPDPQEWLKQKRASKQQSSNSQAIPDPQEWLRQKRASKQQPVTEQKGIGERALESLPGDIKNIGEGVIQAVSHPIDTAKGMGSIVRGGMQSALPDSIANYLNESGISPDSRKEFNAFVDPLKQDFGSIEGFKEAIATHPATTFLNVSGAVSGLGGLVKGATGKAISNAAQSSAQKAASSNALNAQKASVLKRGQEAGYVIPKSEVNPSFINNRLEGFAGKAAIGQQAVLKNQEVTTNLARKALNIADDKPLNVDTLKAYRKAQSAPYEEVAQLPTPPSLAQGYSRNTFAQTSSADDLYNLRQARNDAQGWYDAAKRSASPDDMKKAKAAEAEATRLETRLEQKAIAAGKPELVKKLREARTNIAKSYDIEKSLNIATGQVDPAVIGRSLDKGTPLTGELKQIGEFREAFPKFMKEGEKAQAPGISKVEAITSLLMGTGGTVAAGPIGAIAAAVPLLSTPTRNMLLSGPYQRAFVSMAQKNPNKLLSILDRSVNNNLSPKLTAGLLVRDNKE